MKKLLILIGMLISVQICMPASQVKGALYAEVRGMPGGRIRIYKGAYSTYGVLKNMVSRLWSPQLYFFDKNGEVLAHEELRDGHLLDNSSGFSAYQNVIATITSRLTELPQAYEAELWHIKAPGNQCIEIRDKDQMLIARSSRWSDGWDFLYKGDHIPQNAINAMTRYVSNPDALYWLKISQVKYFPSFWS